MKVVAAIALAVTVLLCWAGPLGAGETRRLAIKAGKIVTMDDADTIINHGVILLADGKVEQVGPAAEVVIPAGYEVIDAGEDWIVPGLVEAHDHSAGSLWDLNDSVYLTNPGLRTVDMVVPRSEYMENALAGGVTTVLVIPGSGSNWSGMGTVVKTFGNTVDECVVRSPGCLKLSQAGNPEWYWYRVGRMLMNWNLAQTLKKARAYHERWTAYERGETSEKPPYDIVWHDLRGAISGKLPCLLHTQWYQVYMMTLLMLHDHFGLRVVTGHSCFDAYRLGEQVRERDLYCIVGPRAFNLDARDRTMNGLIARWAEQGVKKLGVNTDAPVVPQEDLTLQGAMACWYGYNDSYAVLRGITRITAESLDVFDRVGSLQTGKDADVAIWTGNPIDPRSQCKMTLVNGRIAYDAKVRRRY